MTFNFLSFLPYFVCASDFLWIPQAMESIHYLHFINWTLEHRDYHFNNSGDNNDLFDLILLRNFLQFFFAKKMSKSGSKIDLEDFCVSNNNIYSIFDMMSREPVNTVNAPVKVPASICIRLKICDNFP